MFRLFDPKLRTNLASYIIQCLLATVSLVVILAFQDILASSGVFGADLVVVAAIGSTAFVVFIMPHRETATTRHVIGSHVIAVVVRSVMSNFDTAVLSVILQSPVAFPLALEGALSVGLATFLMAATNTEHPPAADTALGVAFLGFSWRLAIFLGTSIVALAVIHRLFRSRLINVY